MRIFLLTLMLLSNYTKLFSQTYAISPTGDGGFETGASFAANGWTTANSSASFGWFLGTATQPAGGGSRTAYVSNNSGTSNAYTLTTAGTSHFYRSVTIPAGATSVNLSFILKSVGETTGNWDQLIVYTGTGAIAAGTPSGSTTALAGYTIRFTQTSTVTWASYTTVSVSNIAGLAGTTFNLLFTWKNDNSAGTNPPAAVDNISLSYVPATPTPTLSNTSSTAGTQTMFSGCRSVTTAPTFSLSLSSAGNTIQLELNTKSDFTGTAYTQTFSGTYSGATLYDFDCVSLSPALPASDETYFVRSRASNDAGSTWSSWTSTVWPYSVKSNANSNEPLGWHCSSEAHFDAGTLLTNNYDNFLVSNNNGTSTAAADDYLSLGIGSSDNSLTAAGDQALTEGTSFYSGGSFSCITVGYYTASGSSQDYHGFRIQSMKIPQAAVINSATFTCYAHNGSGCGGSSNTTNAMFMKIRGVDQDNCNAWANSTNVSTGDPKNRTRTAAGVDWDVPSGASQAWSTGLLLTTPPDVSTIIQPIVNRAGYAAGNAIGVIVDHDAAAGAYWRYFATMTANAAYKARLQTGFDNFYNDIQLPTVALTSFDGATSFSKLYFDASSICGSCYVTFDVRNASNGASLLTTAFAASPTSPITLASSAATVYVIARIKRSGGNTPSLNSVTLTTNTNSLPIELNEIKAKKYNDKDNIIEWDVKSQINNDYFTIEKSKDGVGFYDLGKLKGDGSTTQNHLYSMIDEEPYDDVTYYRLKQTDFDGKQSYSKLVFVDRSKSEFEVKNVHPVPSQDLVSFDVYSPEHSIAHIELLDCVGKIVYSSMIEIGLSSFTSSVSIKEFAGGVYFLRVSLPNGNVFVNKIIKN